MFFNKRPKMLLKDYLKAVSEKKIEIQSMKQKYEEISVTLQNILDHIENVEQPSYMRHLKKKG